MRSTIEIKESISSLEASFRSSDNFKIRVGIQSLILLKQEKFKRQADLADYLGVDRSSLKRWIKQYKDTGFNGLITLKSGGNYKGVISKQLHEALYEKVNDLQDPLLGYWACCILGERELRARNSLSNTKELFDTPFPNKEKASQKITLQKR